MEWRVEWLTILKVVPRWKQYIADLPVRELVNSITNIYHSIEWLQTSSIEYIEDKHVLNVKIDWKEVWVI